MGLDATRRSPSSFGLPALPNSGRPAIASSKKIAKRLIGRAELLSIIPLSYPVVWKMMVEGAFPRSRSIGGKVAWIADEVADWIANRPLVKLKCDFPQQVVVRQKATSKKSRGRKIKL